jgi:hypothetical protein
VIGSIPLSTILGASVRAAGNHVGVVTDAFADEPGEQVMGLEVTGENDRRWFLPWVATTLRDGVAHAASPLVFIPAEQLEFYVERGKRMAEYGADGIVVQPDGRFARRAAGRSAADAAGRT